MGTGRDGRAGQGGGRGLVLDSYGRLSRVPETGELEKIETQWADNRRKIERVGAVLGEELRDGLSAWKRGVRRPGWERLLQRVESGASDGVVVWHTDRLFRQPRDLEKLIDLGERGVKVYSAHGERDLSDADDRFILRVEVAHAARSSDDTSRRIKRRFGRMREQGLGHAGGPRRFGFPGLEHAEHSSGGGPGGGRVPVSAARVAREVQGLREGAEALLSGVSMGQLAREWNAAGLLSAGGKEWIPNTVRDTFKRPGLCGRIEHDGELVGRVEGEPILSEQTFLRLRALFSGRGRGRVAGQRYLGSGILRCGVCGRTLSGRALSTVYRDGTRRGQYLCPRSRRGCGTIYVDTRAVDTELKIFTVRRLSDPQFAAAITAARSQVSRRLEVVRAEIAVCEQLQEALSVRLGRRQISVVAFDKANEPLTGDLARLSAERDSLSAGHPDVSLATVDAAALEGRWDEASVADRRAMLGGALGRQHLVIDPAGRGGRRVFDRSRIRLLAAPPEPETAGR